MAEKRRLNKAQFKAEIEKCLHCASKPCLKACPIGCSPHDFIEAAKSGDMEKAAKIILEANPMGQTCGLVCPDHFCMKACLRANIDYSIKIPAVQAAIISEVKKQGLNCLKCKTSNGMKVAVIGAGPAGMSAAAFLARNGFDVAVFERENRIGGAMNLIPDFRLSYADILQDWENVCSNGKIELFLNSRIDDFSALLTKGFCGVIAAIGEDEYTRLGIEGEAYAVSYFDYLKNPESYKTRGSVAVVGGGAVAVDCAVTAKRLGAQAVEMIVRRRIPDMRVTLEERNSLLENQIDITSMTRLCKIEKDDDGLVIHTCKTKFTAEGLKDIEGSIIKRSGFDRVILAVGSKRPKLDEKEKIFYAGDCILGASTVVEAAASGKKAAENLMAMVGEIKA